MIEVTDLRFGYQRPDDLFRGFSWSARRGEVWAILGPSGCGKTTLLHLLAGLQRPTSGAIGIGGRPVVGPRKSTGLILQDHGLLPWATAEENVALGLRIRGVQSRQRAAAVDHWLDLLGISDVRRQYPWQLSGGQRQRVAIARALVLEPEVLLMDEPFASLDALTREDMQDVLVGLTMAPGAACPTIALVTHDVGEAVLLGQKVMVLPSPPISAARAIDNPLAGTAGYRLRPEFHRTCLAVRAMVEEARGRPPAVPGARPGTRGARETAALQSAPPESSVALDGWASDASGDPTGARSERRLR